MRIIICVLFIVGISFASAQGQTNIDFAKEFYQEKQLAEALPMFEEAYNEDPDNPQINLWYGACMLETRTNYAKAEECLLLASQKKQRDAFLYLGKLYSIQFRFTDANSMFDQYEKSLKKKGEDEARATLEEERKENSRLARLVSKTEDIQIIDSVVMNKSDFLLAYKMSVNTGKLDYLNNVLSNNLSDNSVTYINQKGTKIYYSKIQDNGKSTLFSMEKLIDGFGNEKKLSLDNFGLKGNASYPFVMVDGITIYFSAEDENSMGGYDLFVSRYNMNNDTYLNPERLSLPFNSFYNDYMMVVDEEKGIGWFASDRNQPEDLVCIYTFIPNDIVSILENENEASLAGRAMISSIRDSWRPGKDYPKLIGLAREEVKAEKVEQRDFEFVINNNYTYYSLSDFRDRNAQNTYKSVIQMKNELNTISSKLEQLREEYSTSDKGRKLSISTEILNLEKRVEVLQRDIPVMEKQARNLENQSMN